MKNKIARKIKNIGNVTQMVVLWPIIAVVNYDETLFDIRDHMYQKAEEQHRKGNKKMAKVLNKAGDDIYKFLDKMDMT